MFFSLSSKLAFDLLPFVLQTFTNLGLATRPPLVAPTPPPSSATVAPLRTHNNIQTTMTQHYGVSAGPEINLLPMGWMQLVDAATNGKVYYHKATSQVVLSWTEMFLKSLTVTPLPAPRITLSPATVQSFELPDKAVSRPFPFTPREGTHGTSNQAFFLAM
jgi:hypothetical protein